MSDIQSKNTDAIEDTAEEEDGDFFEEASKPFRIPTAPSLVAAAAGEQPHSLCIPGAAAFGKISFLSQQIRLIESMLSLCKHEIIREFSQRSAITAAGENNADSSAGMLSEYSFIDGEDEVQKGRELFEQQHL